VKPPEPRDELAALIGNTHITTYDDLLALADRIIDAGWQPPRTPRTRKRPRTRSQATCHPNRPLEARGLCKGCYGHALSQGILHQHPLRRHHVHRDTFIDTYQRMRAEGANRRNIADRLGMTRDALAQAYRRAVMAGHLEPDRRTA